MTDADQVDSFCQSLETKNLSFAVVRLEQNIHKTDLVIAMLRCANAILEPNDLAFFNARLDRHISNHEDMVKVVLKARAALVQEAENEKFLAERNAMATGVSTTFEQKEVADTKLVNNLCGNDSLCLGSGSLGSAALAPGSNVRAVGTVALTPGDIPVGHVVLTPEEVKEYNEALDKEKLDKEKLDKEKLDKEKVKAVTGNVAMPVTKVIPPFKQDNIKLPALQGWPECRVGSLNFVVPGRPDVEYECDVAKAVNMLIDTGKKRILCREGIYLLVSTDAPKVEVPKVEVPKVEEKSEISVTNITSEATPSFQLQLTSNSTLPDTTLVAIVPGSAVAPVLNAEALKLCDEILKKGNDALVCSRLVGLVLAQDTSFAIHHVLQRIHSKDKNLCKNVITGITSHIMFGELTDEKVQRQLCNLGLAIQKLR